jgi:competence protein ComEC
MRRAPIVLLAIFTVVAAPAGQARNTKTLDIYVVDTEGGKGTLFVSPSGQSLLIDSGNPGGRDTDRIMAAVADAGIQRLDFLLSTHYHVDHIGGMQELAKRIPIGHFLDHGPSIEEKEPVAGFQKAYADLRSKARHTVVQPGFTVPISGLDWRIVTAAGKALKVPLSGGGQSNPLCAQVTRKDSKPNENNQSVGSVITHGKFRAIDLGDLVWDNELDLMCPNNPIGPVDVYFVSHHGVDTSGSPALVHALGPRVAIMQNGTRKGAAVSAMQILHSSPGLDDIWQLHWSHNGGLEHNSAGVYIANMDEPATVADVLTAPAAPAGRGSAAAAHSPAYWIKVSARTDGTFTVSNTRNRFSKTYTRRAP